MNAERNRHTSWAILFLIGVCLADLPAQTDDNRPKYSGGYGTEQSPYRIATAADLILLGETPRDYDKYFVLTADIDLDPNFPGRKVFDRAVIAPDTNDASEEYEGIPFTGTFDGAGHAIAHMTIMGSGHLSLFGQLGLGSQFDTKRRTIVQIPARIVNLGVVDANIVGSGCVAGALVAHNDQGIIARCYSSGTVKVDWSLAGGLVGINDATITDSHSTCAVSGSEAGGLVGNSSGAITSSCSAGTISGWSNIGGLAGSNSGAITNSYSTSTVSGRYDIGGLVGHNGGRITGSHSTATVTGTDDSIGGLVGNNSGRIVSSHSTATVDGMDWIGGLVGFNCGNVATSYGSGTSSHGHSGVGGLVGSNSGCISVCRSDGNVAGYRYVGGLAGENWGNIIASYSTGSVEGDEDVGGLVGLGGGAAMCYSTAGASGHDDSDGPIEGGGFPGGEARGMEISELPENGEGMGLTTAQMKDINTYLNAGWDFVGETRNGTSDYWQISPGEYPRLAWFEGNRPVMPEGLGTAEQPYLIRNARDLGTVWSEPMAHYHLAGSIDLSGITWLTAVIPSFGGTFDGDHHWIGFLHLRGNEYLGLFGQLHAEASAANLHLMTVEVSGTGICGGLAGINHGSVTECHSDGLIRGYWVIGGLVGFNGGSITGSQSSGLVIGDSSIGGLAGSNGSQATITTSRSKGVVDGYENVGGLVGESSGGSIVSCSSSSVISGSSAVGGLLGRGERIPEADKEQEVVTGCYSTSAVIGENYVGGLIGFLSDGPATRCYSIGAIAGDDCAGGLIGYVLRGDVNQCYSVSAVGGTSNVGALVGAAEDVAVTSCLWDSQLCSRASNYGGIGKTTAEMQMRSTFTSMGWDFEGETSNGTKDNWWIYEGLDYPRLWWETGEPRGDF